MDGAWPMTGRTEELQRIATATGPRGGCTGVVIVGEPGVGKTRLVSETLKKSRGVPRLIVAAGSTASAPLGALCQWVPRDGSNEAQLVERTIDALVADNPRSIVAVDDANLLDELSMSVIHQIVMRRLAPVILTLRRGEPVSDTLAKLWSGGHLQRMDIQPLSYADSVAMVEARLGARLDHTAAQALWQVSLGNPLYLRCVVDHEIDRDRLRLFDEIWALTADISAPPALIDIITARIGALPDDVADVVDFVAMGDPLDLPTLLSLVDSPSVEQAEARGLTTVEQTTRGAVVRPTHPIYGLARNAMANRIRLRRLRGVLADRMRKASPQDPAAITRYAELALDSDLGPDPGDMLRAAKAAAAVMETSLAVRFANTAAMSGGGWPAELAHATCLISAGDYDQAEVLLRSLETADIPESAKEQCAVTRAWALHVSGRPIAAGALVTALSQRYRRRSGIATLGAVTALLAACRADSSAAMCAADTALECEELPDTAKTLALTAKVIALAELGDVEEARRIYDEALDLIERTACAVPLLMSLVDAYVWGLHLAGYLAEARRVVDDIRERCRGRVGQQWIELLSGRTELWAGRAGTAARRMDSLVLHDEDALVSLGWRYRYWIDLVAAYAATGDASNAARVLGVVQDGVHAAFAHQTPQRILAGAWVRAAQGWVSGAVTDARRAAENAAATDQPAQEVVCLQVATRFGDATAAQRLADLAKALGTPRADAAAAHARALAEDDGDALDAVSQQLEAMQDLIAAADAAAQASVAHHRAGSRSHARASIGHAHRLAEACGSVTTPALELLADTTPLTGRQREIVAMAANGLSNREIAKRLSVSVRTVEGHLYQASVRRASIAPRVASAV